MSTTIIPQKRQNVVTYLETEIIRCNICWAWSNNPSSFMEHIASGMTSLYNILAKELIQK